MTLLLNTHSSRSARRGRARTALTKATHGIARLWHEIDHANRRLIELQQPWLDDR